MEYITLIISSIALGLSIYSVIESRKANRVSEEPHLAGHKNEGNNYFCFELKNKGKGPAIFDNVETYYNNERTGEKLKTLIDKALDGIRCKYSVMELGGNNIMGAGEVYKLLDITEIHKEDIEKLKDIMETSEIDLKVIYKNAYGNMKSWATNDNLIKI